VPIWPAKATIREERDGSVDPALVATEATAGDPPAKKTRRFKKGEKSDMERKGVEKEEIP